MSLEQARRRIAANATARVLVLDIETSPSVVYTFDMAPKWIGPDKIIEPGRMLSFSAKWYDSDTVIFKGDYDFHTKRMDGHERMVHRAWELMDQADVLVTYNGVRFDVKHLNKEFALAGLPAPSPFKNVDLYRIGKREFKFESHSLNHLAARFELGQKVSHEGFGLWKACLAGDRDAWKRMREYNEGDILLTQKLYDRMRGWMPNHPHLTALSKIDDLTCNQCGSRALTKQPRKYLAQTLEYLLYRCDDCGGLVKGGYVTRKANTAGVRSM